MSIVWSSELEIGIAVIDAQHHRIVEYINTVDEIQHTHSREDLIAVLNELIDYTVSHFTFEEELMTEAGYPFVRAHAKVHELFARRVSEFYDRVSNGEDITAELMVVLKAWLINHIKRDDKDYSEAVKKNLKEATRKAKAKKGGWFTRLFG